MLILKNKGPVRFEWSDALSESAVTLSPEDDSDTIKLKLQRVLELEENQGLPIRQPGATLQAAQTEFPELFDAAAAEAAIHKTGWAGLADEDIDQLPEM